MGLTVLAVCAAGMVQAQLKVVSLHPYMGDLARQVGGDHVVLTDLMSLGGNPHDFEPTPDDLKQVAEADIVLASGKKLELYLDSIKDNLKKGAVLVEVGRTVPSCLIEADNPIFVCCPAHSVGSLDPHWWHSVVAMKRATKVVEAAFAKADQERSAAYKENSKAYQKELDDLNRWVKKRVGEVPRKMRYLCTAHAAFGYFCRDYRFKAMPIQGLNKEQDPKPKYLAESITLIKKHNVSVVFPELTANPKVLQAMVEESGVRLGGHLLADTPSKDASTYLAAYRYNVNTIVDGILGKAK